MSENNLQELYEKIRNLIGKSPIEVDEHIKLLSEEYNKKESLIRKQLNIYLKEKKNTEKKAGSDLTEKQFYILKKYANPENQLLQQAMEQGLEFINLNDEVRAHCKTFLESIMKERMETTSIKEQVLSLMHRKCYGDATELLVKQIEDNNFIYTTKTDTRPEIFIFHDGIYQENGESQIKEILRDIMEEDYSEWLSNQVLAKIRADTFIDPNLFFKESNSMEIPVLNGILNLETLKLENFNPTKVYFSKIPVRYIEGATCPGIEKFLTEVLSCPEDKEVFYELAGFGLIKSYFLEKSFMLVGNGRNGKTKSIELLKRFVGVNNCASVPLSAIDSNSPFVYKLWKRFFNCAGDINSKDLKDTAMFKQLCGGDMISANIKFKNAIEFHNYAKLVFACNELPRVYDYSDGFWERWVLLEYPYKFVDKNVFDVLNEEEKKFCKLKDPEIIEKITTPEEMSGFLNIALLGLHRLLQNKRFSYTKGTAEVKNKWIRKADSFMAFCMDCLESDYESRISKKEVRKKYKEYCEKHKVSGVSDKSIKATLQEMFGVSEDYGKLTEFHDNFEHFWSGIKWKGGFY
jgi:putative DNA primase/helicase